MISLSNSAVKSIAHERDVTYGFITDGEYARAKDQHTCKGEKREGKEREKKKKKREGKERDKREKIEKKKRRRREEEEREKRRKGKE